MWAELHETGGLSAPWKEIAWDVVVQPSPGYQLPLSLSESVFHSLHSNQSIFYFYVCSHQGDIRCPHSIQSPIHPTVEAYHSVLSVEEHRVCRESVEESLKEGVVQAQLRCRFAGDDGSELLVVPDEHHLPCLAGHDGDHAVWLGAHAALVYHHLR